MALQSLISSWPRRLGLAAAVFAIVFVASVLWLRYGASGHPADVPPSDTTIMNLLFTLPSLLAAGVFALATVFGGSAQAAGAQAAAAAKPAEPAEPEAPFKAQVMGIQWLNPLVWRDYPTEWQLLWVLGLAQPNKNDDMVKENPKKFSKVQPVASIVSNARKKASFSSIFEGYVQQLTLTFRNRYAMNPGYFYTIQPNDPKQWRELGGIRMEFAIPAIADLPLEVATTIVRDQMSRSFGLASAPKLATQNIPADPRFTPGAANAGFTSLNAAMDYLQANPGKTAWVLNWDSPQFPNDESLSENATLLVLAGPKLDTQREPLAWIARPAFTQAQAFEPKESASKISQAWSAALKQAAANAQIKLGEVAYMVHDVGVGDLSAKRVGGLAQALTEQHPEFQYLEQGFNTPKLLGEMRAGTAITNLALAVAWTHQKGKPVLVAGSTEPESPVAVIVMPPSRARIADLNQNWFRARGEGNAYLPWWGLRREADWSKVGQGFSD